MRTPLAYDLGWCTSEFPFGRKAEAHSRRARVVWQCRASSNGAPTPSRMNRNIQTRSNHRHSFSLSSALGHGVTQLSASALHSTPSRCAWREHILEGTVPQNPTSPVRLSPVPQSPFRSPLSCRALRFSQPSFPEVSSAEALLDWLTEAGLPSPADTLTLKPTDAPQGATCFAKTNIRPGDVILKIPENFTVTAMDVANHPVLTSASAGSGDLELLTLWFMWESFQGPSSPWNPYIATFPKGSLSPLTWSKEERGTLLQGFSGLPEIESKVAEIEALFEKFHQSLFSKDPQTFPWEHFSKERFVISFAVVLSRAVYLPSAGIFALVPFADIISHSPATNAALQYDPHSQTVLLVSDKPYAPGQQIFISNGPGLTNADLAVRCGAICPGNPHDMLSLPVGLVSTDPLFPIKMQLLQEEGFQQTAVFPLYADRFPRQLLSYLRLARLSDSAQFAKVTFRQDTVVSETNEYEVLMLLLSECKERLGAYPQTLEDDLRLLNFSAPQPQAPLLGPASASGAPDPQKLKEAKERLAAQLRVIEKKILGSTMNALRARLAPIRGLPTKSGMGDPNSEIKEMFGLMEAGFSAPQRLFSNFLNKNK